MPKPSLIPHTVLKAELVGSFKHLPLHTLIKGVEA